MIRAASPTLGRRRWRCALCVCFGFATTAEQAEQDFYAHYAAVHMIRESA